MAVNGDDGTLLLDVLSRGAMATVVGVEAIGPDDPVARRLVELGFVAGETVQMIAHGPFGADPVAVRLGGTRFALRRAEARRIRLEPA